MNIINEIDRFFSSINVYINYSGIFITFSLLFLFAVIVVIISTAHSYETKLIKAIDKFNKYFINNPNIDENNLLAFNNRMKNRRVPKQLRKQWQQFVLYREHKASHYMSFENCVAAPLRNSSFKRDVNVFNTVSCILALSCLILNLSYASYYEGVAITSGGNFVVFLQHILLCPVLILILNLLFRIMFDYRHNAIVDDLYQNYQYFEVNIDKATETLPEYVDYEVLFDKNEIKRGIPILYIYLQKRAEEEKRELERARLKNVEHEQFNFDEAGVESSLVLERAMQEAENYIAERKKFMQDIEQINSEITQEEVNFREITKEYQRQMQVSKESFDNFKSQLGEASSTIEANYLKKQQQQELDRQRNLERDYDTATERHNKVLQSLQEEVDNYNQQIKDAKRTLEKGMMSEFDTYSSKVYNAAKQAVQDRETKLVNEVNDLKNRLNVTGATTEETEQSENSNYQAQPSQEIEQTAPTQTEPAASKSAESDASSGFDFSNYYSKFNFDTANEASQNNKVDSFENEGNSNEQENFFTEQKNESVKPVKTLVKKRGRPKAKETGKKGRGRPKKNTSAQKPSKQTSKGMGRPKKEAEKPADETKKVSRGRPKKVESTKEEPAKVKRGRPKKVAEAKTESTSNETKRRGRPKKEEPKTDGEVKQTKRGRPKKDQPTENSEPKEGASKTSEIKTDGEVKQTKRGRPKKDQPTDTNAEPEDTSKKKGRGRPKKEEQTAPTEVAKPRKGRPKKVETEAESDNAEIKPTKRGRPKKYNVLNLNDEKIEDIDAYLKEIDNQIKIENEKMKESERELAKNSRLRKKR